MQKGSSRSQVRFRTDDPKSEHLQRRLARLNEDVEECFQMVLRIPTWYQNCFWYGCQVIALFSGSHQG
jgi:hypothetical protein